MAMAGRGRDGPVAMLALVANLEELSPEVVEYIGALDSVPGWFYEIDLRLFAEVDRLHRERGVRGDLLEIGVYHGKSAILMGLLARPEERLMVCDIFGLPDDVSEENRAEHERWYQGYGQQAFEKSYLRFHSELPTIWSMPSTRIDRKALAGSFRLVHVDGSHNYDVVRADIETAQELLGPGGVVVFDDWSTPNSPGTAAAIWEEVLTGQLIPLAVTMLKLYATWDPASVQPAELDDWAARTGHGAEVHQVAGWPVRWLLPK